MPLLSTIEYDAIMQAIDCYKTELETNTFPDNEEGYTKETITQALNRVENYILSANIPR